MQTTLLTLAILAATVIAIRVIIMLIAVEKEISEWNKLTGHTPNNPPKPKPPVNWDAFDTPTYSRKARRPNSTPPLYGRLVLKECKDKIDQRSPFN